MIDYYFHSIDAFSWETSNIFCVSMRWTLSLLFWLVSYASVCDFDTFGTAGIEDVSLTTEYLQFEFSYYITKQSYGNWSYYIQMAPLAAKKMYIYNISIDCAWTTNCFQHIVVQW